MPRHVGLCRLPFLLHMRKMTQIQLSERTGISRQQLSDYCTNRKVMSYANARKISRALNVEMEDLYEG